MYHATQHQDAGNGNRDLSIKSRVARMLTVASGTVLFSMGAAHAMPGEQDTPTESKQFADADEFGSLDSEALANRIVPERMPSASPEEDLRASVGTGLVSVVKQATTMIGIPYHWGGNSPEEGLDCSGFVRYVYRKTTGLLLPRQSAQISKTGSAVALPDLHPGDLVFFDTPRGPATHVGIYMGGQRFIHAPRTGAYIRVESLSSPYWASRYHGARRYAA
jgi:cell wall-associated NlpC family hydrolase